MSATAIPAMLLPSPTRELARVGEEGAVELVLTLTLTHLLVELPGGELQLPLDDLLSEIQEMSKAHGS